MVFDYSPVLAEVGAVIAEFGRDIILMRPNTVSADPAQPWRGATDDDTSRVTVRGVFDDFTIEQRAALEDVQEKDRQLIISATGLTETITPTWRIIDDDRVGQIVAVLNRIEPGDTLIAYVLQVRS